MHCNSLIKLTVDSPMPLWVCVLSRNRTLSRNPNSPAGMSAPGGGGAGPRGSVGPRRRRVGGSGGGGGAAFGGGGSGSNMLRFYTDDAPGLKITPTVVLVMSVCFIGFVTVLHVVGKLYSFRSA